MTALQTGSKLDATDGASSLPPHLANALDAIARLHDSHERAASPIQRGVEHFTGVFAKPATLLCIACVCAAWIAVNIAMPHLGMVAIDLPPFNWLQGGLGLLAVLLTCMILTTQRRADTLAGQRAQLTLELAILAEQKSAKTIALLEELRRDHPEIQDRIDQDADAMAASTDAVVALEALVERDEDAASARDDRDAGRLKAIPGTPVP